MERLPFPQEEQTPFPREHFAGGEKKVIVVEALRVDIRNELVRIGEDYIPLTATEFRILCILVTRSGSIIRRNTLLSTISEQQSHATSRSLDVHISRLRTKLRNYGSCIRTFKGIGYRFIPTIAATPSRQEDIGEPENP